MKRLSALIALSLFALSGCSVFSPVKTQRISYYLINTTPKNVAVSSREQGVLMINAPTSRPIYNTSRIAYSTKPLEVSYFGQNEWAETPAQMLQPLLTQALQNTKHYQAIVTPPYTGPYDFALSTQIVQFETDYTVRPARFKLRANVNLNKANNGELIASKQIRIQVPLRRATPYDGILAANAAVTQLLRQATSFAVRNSKISKETSVDSTSTSLENKIKEKKIVPEQSRRSITPQPVAKPTQQQAKLTSEKKSLDLSFPKVSFV